MKCPNCHHENPEDARFCMGCGNNLALPSESPPTEPQNIVPFFEGYYTL